jgi:CO/xanthine dehydrogenase FAD-binding subunit
MAGGTVAMPLINDSARAEVVMGLAISTAPKVDGTLDRATTLTQLLEQDTVPMLREAARNTASWSIRNMGTVGGNLFTPPPGGDVAVALLALDASVVLASARGQRVLPIAEFFTGFLTNQLAPDELMVRLDVAVRDERTAHLAGGMPTRPW